MKRYTVTVDGKAYDVTVEETGAATPAPIAAPAQASAPAAAPAPAAPAGGKVNVNAPMPGTVLKMNVASGATVNKGDVLCVLEAMKMENEIVAPCDGTIKQLLVSKGSTVDTDQILAVL